MGGPSLQPFSRSLFPACAIFHLLLGPVFFPFSLHSFTFLFRGHGAILIALPRQFFSCDLLSRFLLPRFSAIMFHLVVRSIFVLAPNLVGQYPTKLSATCTFRAFSTFPPILPGLRSFGYFAHDHKRLPPRDVFLSILSLPTLSPQRIVLLFTLKLDDGVFPPPLCRSFVIVKGSFPRVLEQDFLF